MTQEDIIYEEQKKLVIARFKTLNPDSKIMLGEEKEEVTVKELIDHMVVGIDPGKDNLLFCTNGVTKIINGKRKMTTFRYTQNQVRKETKRKKYLKIIEKTKKKIVKKIEERLTKYISKTCIYKKAKEYINEKNNVNKLLNSFYEKHLYRKLKWYAFINKQRSESRMINKFKKIFGSPKDVIVCIGNWGEKKQMRNMEPTKGKSFTPQVLPKEAAALARAWKIV